MTEIDLNIADVEWEPATDYPQGSQWKILRRDQQQNPLSIVLKIPAGFEMREHSHVQVEHHFVLAGSYESMGKHHPAGTYRVIPAHTDHGPFRSMAGAEILILWQPDA